MDKDIITAYTHLLGAFAQNSLVENEAVFTMYYHVIFDLKAIHMLYQIPVFTTFANIWDEQNPAIAQVSALGKSVCLLKLLG